MLTDRPAILETIFRASLHAAAKRLSLTRREASAILDVMNGVWLEPELAGQHLRAEVQDGIALNGLDQKWEVDGRSLVSRLRELPLPLSAAVELWAAEFWNGAYNDPDFERAHLARMVKEP